MRHHRILLNRINKTDFVRDSFTSRFKALGLPTMVYSGENKELCKLLYRRVLIWMILFYPAILTLQAGFGSNWIRDKVGVYPAPLILFVLVVHGLAFLVIRENRVLLVSVIESVRSTSDGIKKSPKFDYFEFYLSYLCLAIFSVVYFSRQQNFFFAGTDGSLQLSLNESHELWGDSRFYFNTNFLQGLGGNLPFPYNHRIDPGYIIGNLSAEFNITNALVTWCLLLSISIFAITYSLKLSQKISTLAAWLGPILILVPSNFNFSLIPTLTPHMLTSISITNFLIAMIFYESRNFREKVIKGILINVFLVYYLISNPTFLMLSVPILGTLLFILLWHNFHNKRRKEVLWDFIPFLIPTLMGSVYLIGIFLYTSIFVYQKEHSVPEKLLKEVSMLFSSRPLVSVLFLVSMMTGLLLIGNKSLSRRITFFALGNSVIGLAIPLLGLIFQLLPEVWRGPSLFYFEFMTWSIHAVLLSLFLNVVRNSAIQFSRGKQILSKKNLERYASNSVLILILSAYCIGRSVGNLDQYPQDRFYHDKSQSQIIDFLEKRFQKAKSNYIGRVYSVTGFSNNENLSWVDTNRLGKELFINFGSDFRQGTLWSRGIPTIFEVNQLITPRSYFLLSRSLGRPGDMQMRDFVLTREVSAPILQLLGVRYVVSDNKLPLETLILKEERGTSTMFLYELTSPNIGNYFATSTETFTKNSDLKNFLKLISTNIGGVVQLEDNIQVSSLVKPSMTSLQFWRGSYFYTAFSKGESLVVLPIEFSSCFDVKSRVEGAKFTILPAYVGLTAVIFQGKIELELRYSHGLFKNTSCRARDLIYFLRSDLKSN